MLKTENEQHRGEQGPARPRVRKPYRAPKLIRYGPVRELTLGHGTQFNDSGAGKALHVGS